MSDFLLSASLHLLYKIAEGDFSAVIFPCANALQGDMEEIARAILPFASCVKEH